MIVGNGLRNSIATAVLMALSAGGGVIGGIKFYTGASTPDDVLAQFPQLNARLDAIEDRLSPEKLRPNPWTSLQAAQQEELTRKKFVGVENSLTDINKALADLRQHILRHQLDHHDEKTRSRYPGSSK